MMKNTVNKQNNMKLLPPLKKIQSKLKLNEMKRKQQIQIQQLKEEKTQSSKIWNFGNNSIRCQF